MINYIKYTLLVLVVSLLSGCEKDHDSIFTQLDIRIVMPDTTPFKQLNVVSAKSHFKNINTYEQVEFPSISGNKAAIELRKGVYTLILEVEAEYKDGSTKLLRNADHNQTTQALTWVDGHESIVLLLKSIN